MNKKKIDKKIDLKILLIKKGLKQKEVANILGVSKGAVTNFIAGRLKSKKINEFFEALANDTSVKISMDTSVDISMDISVDTSVDTSVDKNISIDVL